MPGFFDTALFTAFLTIVSAEGQLDLQNPTSRDADETDAVRNNMMQKKKVGIFSLPPRESIIVCECEREEITNENELGISCRGKRQRSSVLQLEMERISGMDKVYIDGGS